MFLSFFLDVFIKYLNKTHIPNKTSTTTAVITHPKQILLIVSNMNRPPLQIIVNRFSINYFQNVC